MKLQKRIGITVMLFMSLVMMGIPQQKLKAAEFNVESFNLTLVEDGGTFSGTFTATGQYESIDRVVLNFMNEDTSDTYKYSYIYSKSFDTLSQRDGVYHLEKTGVLDFVNEGKYRLKEVVLYDQNSGFQTISKETQGNGINKDCFNTVYQYTPKVQPYPQLESIEPINFSNSITFPDDNLNCNYKIKNQEQYEKTAIELAYVRSNGRTLTITKNSLNEISCSNDFRFFGSQFKLSYIKVLGYANGGLYMSYYSTIPSENFGSEVGFEPPKGALFSLTPLLNGKSFDFGIVNEVVDTKPPVITSASWTVSEAILPASINFSVTMVDEAESKDSAASGLYYCMPITNINVLQGGRAKIDGDNYKYTYQFGRYETATSLETRGVYAEDQVGNKVIYAYDVQAMQKEVDASPNLDGTIVRKLEKPIAPVKLKHLFEYEEILNNQNDNVEKIKNAKEGTTFVIDTHSDTLIKEELFAAIKGRDITLIFEDVYPYASQSQAIQWVINGKDVITPKAVDTAIEIGVMNHQAMDVDYVEFAIDSSKPLKEQNNAVLQKLKETEGMSYYYNYLLTYNVEKDNYYELFTNEWQRLMLAKFKFEPNGELPGKMMIRFIPEFAFRSIMPVKDLAIYYLNGTKQEYVDDVQIGTDGSYEFLLTHNSEFIMGTKSLMGIPSNDNNTKPNDKNENVSNKETDNKKAPNTGDESNALICMGMLMLSGYVITHFKIKRQ